MGEVDPVSGDLVPPIHMSTTFERQTDGSYLQDRVYTRADNPTFEHTERLLAALEGGSGCAFVRFWYGGDDGDLPVAGSGRPCPRRPSLVLRRSQVVG
jgi:Cys/Met metabolism PLP-dependent enzyme